MEPPRQKLFARIALLVLTALGLAWLGHLDFSKKISTNVIDLIPTDESSPALSLVRSLANERQARVLLFALSSPSAPSRAPDEAAQRFAETLRKSPAMAEAAITTDPDSRDQLGKFIFDRRFDLLLPSWLSEERRAYATTGQPAEHFASWLGEQVAGGLDKFVARPESVAFQALVPSDPLLLVPSLVQKTQSLATSGSAPAGMTLIWARIKDSPFTDEGQAPVFRAIERSLAEGRLLVPDLKVEWTGVNRFAAEGKERVRKELSWLNTLSLLAVLGVACIFVRRLWKVVHLVPVVLLSVLGAWVVATMAFDRLHILVFVVGALLTGVAIDYGFYLYMQPALQPDELYREKLSRLIKPLLASCLTTVIGFSLLLFSELPLIRQLGVFVSAGLVSALGAAILYFAQLERPFLETRTFVLPKLSRARGWKRFVFAAGALIAVLGPWRLHWHDDIRELEIPALDLHLNDQHLRSLFGETDERAAYLTQGSSPAEARAALERFLAWDHQKFPNSTSASLGLVLPTEADWLALPSGMKSLGAFPSELRGALERHGYTADSFSAFFESWGNALNRPNWPPYSTLVDDLRGQLTGPLGLLFNDGPSGHWFMTIADHPPGVEPPPEVATVSVDQLQKLNTLFSQYRASALRLSVIGLSLVGASVFVLYGWSHGLRIFMIPCGSCFFTFGFLGLCGQTLNLFHLLGAFLGVCLSHNYAIFSAENARRHEAPPPSIRLSALTAASSFGVLALSKIAVVAALGTTVALIVLTALVMVELETLGEKPRPL